MTTYTDCADDESASPQTLDFFIDVEKCHYFSLVFRV